MKASYIPCSYIHTMHTIGHGAILLTCNSIDISSLHDYAQHSYFHSLITAYTGSMSVTEEFSKW